jgi:hypothetical protein
MTLEQFELCVQCTLMAAVKMRLGRLHVLACEWKM